MEARVEMQRTGAAHSCESLRVRLLGRIAVSREGAEVELPASRKARALLAYLTLAERPVARAQLCDLLWDGAADPRGELRGCLSRLRALLDETGRSRVIAEGDAVRLDLDDLAVDAREVERAVREGLASLGAERLFGLASTFAGEFAEGLSVEGTAFDAWAIAQRRRFGACEAAVLEQIARVAPGEDALPHLERWVALAPFDRKAHEALLGALARGARIREGEEHVAATVRMFEREGLDGAPIREAWRAARANGAQERSPLVLQAAQGAGEGGEPLVLRTPRRASIAVMPFDDRSGAADPDGLAARALVHDVITRLAKLRSLFVIAQGTVFALHERRIGAEAAGRMLDIDYVVGGSVRRDAARIRVEVELVESRSARVVWAERYEQKLDDAFAVLEDIGDRIVASVATEIETVERNRAILKPPSSLDAWETYHRGLWHMYRFTREDNERARAFFESAVRADPTFSRAYAGLSFTHFQNAFQGWVDRATESERAYAAAGQALTADDRDPAAHWAMGRALWLQRHHDQALDELEQAVELSPNFASGHYTLAFVHAQSGDAGTAIRFADHSQRLSPFDPLLFAMLGSRAMALVRLGRFDEATEQGLRAASRPNAHPHILAIAAFSLALAGRHDDARAHAAALRRAIPHYRVQDFLTAMQFDAAGEALFLKAARTLGFD